MTESIPILIADRKANLLTSFSNNNVYELAGYLRPPFVPEIVWSLTKWKFN